jgi:hypothetical protein
MFLIWLIKFIKKTILGKINQYCQSQHLSYIQTYNKIKNNFRIKKC